MATKTKWYCCTKCAEVDSYEVYDDGDTSFPRGEYLVHRDYIMVADTREEAEQELIDFGVIQWLDTMVGITPAQPTADTPPAAPRMNYIKCPHCDGNGGKRYTHLGGTSGIMTGFQECKHCNGTGSIEATATPPAAPSETTEKWGKPSRVRDSDLLYDATDVAALQTDLAAARAELDTLKANYNPHLTSKIFSEQTLRLQAAEKAIEAAKEYIAVLEAESASRLNALNEKAEELRREWQRAENAEAERDDLRRKLGELMRRANDVIQTAHVDWLEPDHAEFADHYTLLDDYLKQLSKIPAKKGASDV